MRKKMKTYTSIITVSKRMRGERGGGDLWTQPKFSFINFNQRRKSMEEWFSYKGKDYRVDDKGKIYEDMLFGSEVGKKDKDGNITIQTGIFTKEEGRS
jgi:hypothetical protein